MKKKTMKLKGAIVGVLSALISIPALSCNMIKLETLTAQNLSEQDIQILIDESVLQTTEESNQFLINQEKIEDAVQAIDDQELRNFLDILRMAVSSNTNVNNPSCDDMVISTQDVSKMK